MWTFLLFILCHLTLLSLFAYTIIYTMNKAECEQLSPHFDHISIKQYVVVLSTDLCEASINFNLYI